MVCGAGASRASSTWGAKAWASAGRSLALMPCHVSQRQQFGAAARFWPVASARYAGDWANCACACSKLAASGQSCGLLVKLVDPGTADHGGVSAAARARTAVALGSAGARCGRPQTDLAPGPAAVWRTKARRGAQQAGPMHQACQRGQVGDVEVVGLVQHQVAAHQAQHGRDLAAAALAFGGGRQVVDGADQHGASQQFAHVGVGHGTAQQRVRGRCCRRRRTWVSSSSSAWLRRGTGGLGLRLVVLKQRPAGRAAHADGEVVIAQA